MKLHECLNEGDGERVGVPDYPLGCGSRAETTEVPGRTHKEATGLGLHRVGHGTHECPPTAKWFGDRKQDPGGH
eukprot:15443704-Alexandrium_andersonii.AAC.1